MRSYSLAVSQLVLNGHNRPLAMTDSLSDSTWSDTLTIPAYFAAASVFNLLLHSVFNSKPIKKLRARIARSQTSNSEPLLYEEASTGVPAASKGYTKSSFKVAQLAGCLIVAVLSLVEALQKSGSEEDEGRNVMKVEVNSLHLPQLVFSVTMAYISLLSLSSLSTWHKSGELVSKHLNMLLLVTFGVLAYRDLWPLVTITLQPLDRQGWILWTEISVLAVISLILPIIEPHKYIPADPKNPATEISPQQTASLLSIFLYSWLDPTLALAQRVPHLEHNQLPPLADSDAANILRQKSFPYLDPFAQKKKRHIFFGILTVYRKEYIRMVFTVLIEVIGTLISPIAINRLLTYLEFRGDGMSDGGIIRPWFWICLLFIGPMITTLSMEFYLYSSTKLLVRTEAILVQLIFEHALRIRMKAETGEAKESSAANATLHLDDSASIAESSTSARKTDSEDDDETLQASSEGTSVKSANSKGKQKSDEPRGGEEQIERPVPKAQRQTDNLVGRINNLVTSDLTNVTNGRDFIYLAINIPVQTGLSILLLYTILGWSSFVGLAVMLVMVPIPGILSHFIQHAQKQKMLKTDARVQAVTETMNVLRMIKLFGWEQRTSKKVAAAREEELTWIWRNKVLELAIILINFIIPIATMLATFASYTLMMKKDLSAAVVFSSITVFDTFQRTLHLALGNLPRIMQAKVSLDRVNDYLLTSELLDSVGNTGDKNSPVVKEAGEESGTIGFKDALFTWYNASADSSSSLKRNFTLKISDEVHFQRGRINLIIGPTGSGKSSMLMALLGEMHFIASSPESSFNLPRKDGVAYAAQESWVQNYTIQANILFGAPYEKERYEKVLYQCGLERDISLFEAGDQTEVGEKGLTLSGGQKARLTLARAIYSSAQTLLLDDILAALDVHTAKWIVDKCLAGDLVQGRTVILVTHNVVMASKIAHFVVSLGSNGKLISHGLISDVLDQHDNLAPELIEETEGLDIADQVIDDDDDVAQQKAQGKLVVAEEIAQGHVGWAPFKLYFDGVGGNYPLLFWILFVSSLTVAQISENSQPWFLGYWASQYADPGSSAVNVKHYLAGYTLIVFITVALFGFSYVWFLYGGMRASRVIHKKLLAAVLGTTLRWLDTTPTGRVIARCTQDIQAVDGVISHCIQMWIDQTIGMLIKLVAVVVLTPVFAIPGVLVGVLGGWCGRYYMKAQLSVKREVSNAKSPVLSHFAAAIAGLVSIRAYGVQTAFKEESLKRIDHYTKPALLLYNLNRWISIRIETLGALFSASLAAYLAYGNSAINPSNIGFSLNMAVGFSSMILWWVRLLNEIELNGNSLERIDSYTKIEQEPKPNVQGRPPAYWPASGDLRVENLSARYSKDGPRVLHNLSFHIKSGERVGVVGWTGSGKSSLTLSLLRGIPIEGEVYYDGIPTNSINLDALRYNITIIPQVPELLSGTLRHNLDPFDQHDDATLNDALHAAGLFTIQEESEESKLSLDSIISGGGGNLSMGERQILALARAMIRGSKLLILDEATSAIDYKTDATIQSSLRTKLQNDVTQIIVAHRLQTIIDADKIMVLDGGRIVEFGTPKALLSAENGFFRTLVDESADKETLYNMVRK